MPWIQPQNTDNIAEAGVAAAAHLVFIILKLFSHPREQKRCNGKC